MDETKIVKVGEKAPDFSSVVAFEAGKFTKVGLSDYKGKWVTLFF